MNHRISFALLFVLMLVLPLLGVGCDVLQPVPTPDQAATSAAETKAVAARLTAQAPTATRAPLTATPVPTATRTAIPTSTPVRPTPTLTPVPAIPTPRSTKQITLSVVEGLIPVPGRTVWMGYFDENTQTWVTTTRITDPTGIAVFEVPVSKSGESFTFAFSSSAAELPRLYADIRNGKWAAFKIPSDPAQTGVTLEMDPGRLTFRTIQGVVNAQIMK